MAPILGIWASQGRVVAGDFESIATVTVGSGGASTVDFTSIAGTYQHLQIRYLSRDNYNGNTGAVQIQLNSDTNANNYSLHLLDGNGSSASPYGTANYFFQATNASALQGSNIFGAGVIDILDYANTNKNKTIRGLSGVDNNGSGIIRFSSGAWYNTNAITSIRLYPNTGSFVQYATFALYGIKGVA